MDVDWCLSCSRHLSTCTHNHNHTALIHVPISRRDDYDDDDSTDNDDDQIIIPVHDAPKTAISRWASQIPPNASPHIAPQDPSRPPCLSVQPTRPSPPTLCLHTPEKVVTYQAEASSSAIPLKRMSSHPHGGFLSTIASHVKSLVTRPHLHSSHSPSSESEPEHDLWWTLPSSSKHPIPSTSTATSYASSSSSTATFSSTSLHTPSQSYSSSIPPKTNQKHKPIPIRRSSQHHQLYVGYEDTYFEPQPRYLPIPPSKSSIKQRRLVDDFEELDQDPWEGEDRTRTEWREEWEEEGEEEYGTPVPLRVQHQPQPPPSQSQLRVKTKERRAHHRHHHSRTTRGTLVNAALVGRL